MTDKSISNIWEDDRGQSFWNRPTIFDLIQYGSGKFDDETTCNDAVTNCKANYFGLAESDPYIARKPCKQLTYNGVTKWYNVCQMRANRLRDSGNFNKFDIEFRPGEEVKDFPLNYLEFLTPVCAKNPNHAVCKDIVYNMKYDKDAMYDTNTACNNWQNTHCIYDRYGNLLSDPVFTAPTKCIRDPTYENSSERNFQYPYCTLQSNLIREDNFANVFYSDFKNTPNSIAKEFSLSAYCETAPTAVACRTFPGLWEQESFATATECGNWNKNNASMACLSNQYDSSTWKGPESTCQLAPDGTYRNLCLAYTNVDVSDRDAKTIHKWFNRENNGGINEIALMQVLRPYCSKAENRAKTECVFNTHPNCKADPWKASCGGIGDKCVWDPTLLECSDDCKNHPWMTVCGGDGNPCPTEPTAPGCEYCANEPWLVECGGSGNKCDYTPTSPDCNAECATKPWLVECGGSGNKCDYTPTLPECNPECATKPWLVECGGDGNICPFDPTAPGCENPCTSKPWLVECGGDGDMCKYNPNLPECEAQLCTEQPWLLSCGGNGDRCEFDQTFPECVITKDRHPFVWIALLVTAIIVTYMITKR